MQKILGFIILIGFLFFTTASSAKQYFPVFIDIPSALIVVVITVGYMMAISSSGDWSNLFKFTFGAQLKSMDQIDGISQERARSMCTLLTGGTRAALAAGFIGTLIGFVIILMNMTDISEIFPTIAVAIMTTIYGLVLSELIMRPMYRIAVKRYKLS